MIDEHKYAFGNRENLTQLIQMQLSKRKKNIFSFLLHFQKLHQHFDKKMSLIAYVFGELETVRDIAP